jgi:hypothetical protein
MMKQSPNLGMTIFRLAIPTNVGCVGSLGMGGSASSKIVNTKSIMENDR